MGALPLTWTLSSQAVAPTPLFLNNSLVAWHSHGNQKKMAAFPGDGSLFIGYRRYIYRVHKINNCTFSIHSPRHERLVDLSKAQDTNSLCPLLTTRPILGKKDN